MTCPNCGGRMVMIISTNTYVIYWCSSCGKRETVVMRREAR